MGGGRGPGLTRAGANRPGWQRRWPEVTDGPFAETKEFLAGYRIVDVDSTQRAYAIAAAASAVRGPAAPAMRIPIEVREVMSAPPVEP